MLITHLSKSLPMHVLFCLIFLDSTAQHFVNGMGPSSMQNHAHYSQGDVTHNGGLFPVNSSSGNSTLYQSENYIMY